ncbi:MAG: hypothetical protein F6J93_17280 [Oscillatoria sp. SIO1A7]|nr:hypothetical protein [Oscillatoria sp. SIO1A7]
MIAVSPVNNQGIMEAGREALREALGSVGMMRFIHQFSNGSGDYTRDREKLLADITLDEIVELAKEQEDLPLRRFENAIDTSKLTQGQIRQMGMEALLKALGLAETKQFIQSFDPEGGNFIRVREPWFDAMTMEEIFKLEMKEWKATQGYDEG